MKQEQYLRQLASAYELRSHSGPDTEGRLQMDKYILGLKRDWALRKGLTPESWKDYKACQI